jgi:hypothetical protein
MISSTTGSFHAGRYLLGYPPDNIIQQVDDWLSNLFNAHRDQSIYDHYARIYTYMHIIYHIYSSCIRAFDRELMERIPLKITNYMKELLPLNQSCEQPLGHGGPWGDTKYRRK